MQKQESINSVWWEACLPFLYSTVSQAKYTLDDVAGIYRGLYLQIVWEEWPIVYPKLWNIWVLCCFHVDIFCQLITAFIVDLLLGCRDLKVEDMALLKWWAMTAQCVGVRPSCLSGITNNGKWETVEFLLSFIFIEPFSFPFAWN